MACPKVPHCDGEGSEEHLRFGSLSMMLTLLTAINNGGHPTLKLDTQTYRNLEPHEPPKYLVLNAVVAVLVRNHEVIAAAGHAANAVIAVHDELTEDELPTQDNDDLDAAMNNGQDNKETPFRHFTGFAAVPNPDDNLCADDIVSRQSHWSK
jgi:hypothetical protein